MGNEDGMIVQLTYLLLHSFPLPPPLTQSEPPLAVLLVNVLRMGLEMPSSTPVLI